MNNAKALLYKAQKKGKPVDPEELAEAELEDAFVKSVLEELSKIPTHIKWEPSYDGAKVTLSFWPFGLNFPFHYVIRISPEKTGLHVLFHFSVDWNSQPLGGLVTFPTSKEALKYADSFYKQSCDAGSHHPTCRSYLPIKT